jgi:hypothetical protein
MSFWQWQQSSTIQDSHPVPAQPQQDLPKILFATSGVEERGESHCDDLWALCALIQEPQKSTSRSSPSSAAHALNFHRHSSKILSTE